MSAGGDGGARPARPEVLLGHPPALRPVLDLAVDCEPAIDVGPVPGGFRRIVPITGGWFAGIGEREIQGEVLPGGSDWNLQRPDGAFEVWARYLLRTGDGAVITITNSGLISFDGGAVRARTIARFEVAETRYGWLTQSILVGHLEARDPFTGVDIRLHAVD